MHFNIEQISLLFIGFESFIFSLLLFTNNNLRRLSDNILACFFLVLSIQMGLLFVERISFDFESYKPFLCVFGFGYGPLLYLYTQSVIYNDFSFKTSKLVHFIPACLMLISALIGKALCPKLGSLLYISLVIYTIISVKSIKEYREIVKQTQSTMSLSTLSWLQWIQIVFTITFLIDIYQHFYDSIDIISGLSLVNIFLFILIIGMFFKGIKQSVIFQGITELDKSIIKQKPFSEQVVENNIIITPEYIMEFMEKEKPFQNADLTLKALSHHLGISPRQLSEIINMQIGKNFIDFINSYRINMSKKRLLNPKDPKETILEVMYEVGFNSKSSFNTLFKLDTGMTPTEFKQSGTRLNID